MNTYCKLSEDVAEMLNNYLKELCVKFTFECENIHLHELFMYNGCMPLFLYDKEKMINEYINELNEDKSLLNIKNYWAKLIFIEEKDLKEPSFFAGVYKINHNLKENEQEYNNLVSLLVSSILNQKSFKVENGKIEISSLFNKFEVHNNQRANKTPITIQE